MKPTTREKKGQEKRKKRGGEKAKSKSLEILLSVRAPTSQANILNLDQKAAKCTTCKRICGKL